MMHDVHVAISLQGYGAEWPEAGSGSICYPDHERVRQHTRLHVQTQDWSHDNDVLEA